MYRIRRAAELAGMSPELLRAWERRYGLVEPVRTDAGYRVYTDEDVRLLRGARRLVEDGRSIADIARLPKAQILSAAAPAPAAPPVVNARPHPGTEELSPVLQEALDAIAAFDQEQLEATLFRVMGLSALSAEEVCGRFLLPLLKAIGDGWEQGRLSVAAEHFGSSIIRSKILRLIDHERAAPGAPPVICACPAGEEHEGALLAFAVAASRRGLRPIYLGADTPPDDIVRAAETSGAQLIALSITSALKVEQVDNLVRHVGAWRAGGLDRQALVGGVGALQNRSVLEAGGLTVADGIPGAVAALAADSSR